MKETKEKIIREKEYFSKKTRVFITVVMAMVTVTFFGCPQNSSGGGTSPAATFNYVCTNGVAVVGTTTTENTENCASCNTGFQASGDRCLQSYNYVCTNGVAVAGTTTTENAENCANCNTGYILDDDSQYLFFTKTRCIDSGCRNVGTNNFTCGGTTATCNAGFAWAPDNPHCKITGFARCGSTELKCFDSLVCRDVYRSTSDTGGCALSTQYSCDQSDMCYSSASFCKQDSAQCLHAYNDLFRDIPFDEFDIQSKEIQDGYSVPKIQGDSILNNLQKAN